MSEWHGSIPSAAVPACEPSERTNRVKVARNRRLLRATESSSIFCSFALDPTSDRCPVWSKQAMVREGKCCRRFVACSTASAASPSIIRPSKFSSSNACTASDRFRTICISKSSTSSRMASARSWKTGSAFMVRSLVSTIPKQVEKVIAGTLPTLFVPADSILLSPAFPRWWLRKVLGGNRVCRPKMDLRHLPKDVRSLFLNNLFARSFYRWRYPPLQSHSQLFPFPVEPVNKRFTGQNRGRRDRNVRFGARPLLDLDLLPMPQQRLFNHPRIRELVG